MLKKWQISALDSIPGWNEFAEKFVPHNESWRPFNEAREFARSLNLKNICSWKEFCRSGQKPNDVPNSPWVVYDEWVSTKDWLGFGRVYRNGWMSFIDARKFVVLLKLTSINDWNDYCKSGRKPYNIPSSPYTVYKAEWNGWGYWLGYGFEVESKGPRVRSKYLPFGEARDFSRSLGFKFKKEWITYCETGKKPINIPSYPNSVYKDWVDWYDWLGVDNKRKLSLEDIKNFHLSTAERLIKENGGKIPTYRWCLENGYSALIQYIKNHPEIFSNIERSFACEKLEQHIITAETLAKSNRGKLPLPGWLRKHGYDKLRQAINKHPEKFVHIKKEMRLDTAAENKRKLLQMARNGDPKPRSRTSLGSLLSYYLISDSDFRKKLTQINPQWSKKCFIPNAHDNKLKLLQMAMDGKPKPTRNDKLGRALDNYTRRTCSSYDVDFDTKIRKLAPHWFKKAN